MTIVVFALTAFSVLLLVAAAAAPLARKLGQPQPVLFAALGLSLGLATTVFGVEVYQGALDHYERWFVEQLALDSGAMLHVFLPPLLFEMALAVNVRRLLDDATAVLVMAILAVLLATVAVGLSAWLLTPIPVAACLLLGAAVATTDPGAVIATFREIGAPRRLLVILEGESLLNDAAAIAIFSLLMGVLLQEVEPSVVGISLDFVQSFAAGAAMGVATAYLAGFVYPILARSSVAEMSVTVAVAYGAFIAAELLVGASGVVAVVFAGLATGHSGFLKMGPGNWNTVRTVWTQIGFWANALIMIIAASLVPALIAQAGWLVAPITALAYVGATAARATVLFALLPVMAKVRLTAPLTRPQSYLALWGGVRGSVTLVLAISIADIEVLGPDAPVLAAAAAAYTLATVFLNASTLAWLTGRLGLNQLSSTDQALREKIAAGAIERVRTVIADVTRARQLEPEAIRAVEEALGARRDEAEALAEEQAGGERIPFRERLSAGLAIAAGQEARLVRRAFEDGAISASVANTLRTDAERIADAARTEGPSGYRAAAELALRPKLDYRIAAFIQRTFHIDGPLRRAIEQHFITILEAERVVRELMEFADRTVAPMIGDDAAVNLAGILAARYRAVDAEIDAVAAQYPAYALEVEKALIARAAIRRERHQYLRLLNDGVIGQELYDSLTGGLDRRERETANPPRLDLALTPLELIDRVQMFQPLDAAQRKRVARKLRSRFAYPGEVVANRGDRAAQLYFVASGALEARSEGPPQRLATGDFFGEMDVLDAQARRTVRVTSLGYSSLLVLNRRDLESFRKRAPEIEKLICAAVEAERAETPKLIPPPEA